MVERLLVVRITLLERSLTQADILLHRVVGFRSCDGRFVNYILSQALLFHRTGFLSDTVAGFSLL